MSEIILQKENLLTFECEFFSIGVISSYVEKSGQNYSACLFQAFLL